MERQSPRTLARSLDSNNRKTPLLPRSRRGTDDTTTSDLTLVTIHRHPLRVSAQFALRSRADGPAVRLRVAVLLQRHQLLGAEGLVVNLGRRLDEVLQVCPGEEIAEEDKLAVVLVLDVDDAPAVLTASDLAAGHDDGLLRTYDRKGDDVLGYRISQCE